MDYLRRRNLYQAVARRSISNALCIPALKGWHTPRKRGERSTSLPRQTPPGLPRLQEPQTEVELATLRRCIQSGLPPIYNPT